MATTKKAEVTARELLDILGKRVISTLPSQVQSVDSNGNPVITLSADATPATGEKVVVIRVAPQTWTATDALGNTAINYGPHTVEICTELNYAATTDNVADILTPFELLPVIGDCVKTGCKVLWYSTANGTVPSSSAMTAANLKASYSDLYWGMQKAQ
jgi:hypothetical protein